MLATIKEALGTSRLEGTGRGGGGCINEGEVYRIDNGKVFIKRNSKSMARLMFEGELASLNAIIATKTVHAPKPYVVVDNPKGGAVLVMDYVEMQSLRTHSAALGKQLAEMHQHNLKLLAKVEDNKVGEAERNEAPVTQFGFHVDTCCGYLPQNNSWCQDWVEFYSRKLQQQMDTLEKEYGDRQARELWSQLQLKIPQFFKGIEVKPSLLHGDLWGGNAAENSSGPVIFDPASFYGHYEFDVAISAMFGGFGRPFWAAYHSELPKEPGWSQRHELYQLFHNINHWNHFGSGYKSGSLSIMRHLCKC